MSSNYRVFLRAKDGYPYHLIKSEMDAACYHGLLNILKEQAKIDYQPRPHPSYNDHQVPELGHHLVDRFTDDNIKCDMIFGNPTLTQTPIDRTITRVYWHKVYFGNTGPDRHHSCANIQPLPLDDNTVQCNGYINPRYVGRLFKQTLRMIPEFQKTVGPCEDDFSIDLIPDTNNMRRFCSALWMVRRLDERVNGWIQPNLVVTARAFASIAPGLALMYLLSLESSWMNGVLENIIHSNVYDDENGRSRSLEKSPNTPWQKNINPVADLKYRVAASQSHNLNAFTNKEIRYGEDHVPTLRMMQVMIGKGKIPRSVGVKDITPNYNHGTIQDMLSCRVLKHTPPEYLGAQQIHIGLQPEQVGPTAEELVATGKVTDAEVLDQLNNISKFLFRKPINYFIKGWKADA